MVDWGAELGAEKQLSEMSFALHNGDHRRRAHGSEPASMQCGSPVASPETATGRFVEKKARK